MRQLEIIRPKVVASMGNSALSYFQSCYGLGEEVIGDAHGRVYEVMASWGPGKTGSDCIILLLLFTGGILWVSLKKI